MHLKISQDSAYDILPHDVWPMDKNNTEYVEFLVVRFVIGLDMTNRYDFFKVAMYYADCSIGKNLCDLIGIFVLRRQLALSIVFCRGCHEEDPIVDFVAVFNAHPDSRCYNINIFCDDPGMFSMPPAMSIDNICDNNDNSIPESS